jgi:hypothetical protein
MIGCVVVRLCLALSACATGARGADPGFVGMDPGEQLLYQPTADAEALLGREVTRDADVVR